MRKRIIWCLVTVICCLSIAAPVSAATVCFSFEKFTLGQGYIVEPTFVEVEDGTSVAKITTDLLDQRNIDYKISGTVETNFYLSTVEDAAKTVALPAYLQAHILELGSKKDSAWLGEFDYSSEGGWMYTINGTIASRGGSETLLHDGDVLRWQFTLCLGKDLTKRGGENGDSTILPAGASTEKEALMRAIATVNGRSDKAKVLQNASCKGAYNDAVATMQNMVSTKDEVESAEAALSAALKAYDNAGNNNENPVNPPVGPTDPGPDPDPEDPDNPEPTDPKDEPTAVDKMQDITDKDIWYYGDVSYVLEREIMKGTSATSFGISENMTRAQFVTVLGRYAGIEDSNAQKAATTQFADVPSTDYYAAHVAWAVEKEITNGTAPDTFSPHAPISRQDIATMMMRYATAMQITLPAADLQRVTLFADDQEIAPYAREAVYIMKGMEILKGKEGNRFAPNDTAIRVEVAAIIHRFITATT